jgi:uncharacterized Tic20 family protein
VTDDQKSDRDVAALTHLMALTALIGVPLGHLLGPLVVWLVRRDRSEFVDAHGRAAVNFQITVSLALLSLLLCVGATAMGGGPIGGVLPAAILIGAALVVLDLLFVILGAARAHRGEPYRYPLALPWI